MRVTFLIIVFIANVLHAQRADFILVDFKKADSIAHVYKDSSLKNLPVLVHHLTSTLQTDVEKFRAIYTWIGTAIENDYASYLKISNKRKRFAKDRDAFLKWNHTITPKVFHKLLNERKTACTGYAYLVKEMANLAGFRCTIIDGYGRTPTLQLTENSMPNHSWNSIEIGGKWYVCDATWSAGETIIDNGTPRFSSQYFDGYFLAEPTLFIKNHYPLIPNNSYPKPNISFTEFLEGPVIYKEAFRESLIPVLPEKMHSSIKKGDSIAFHIQVPKTFTGKLQVLINKYGNQIDINSEVQRKANVMGLVQYFDRKGLYDVHITANNEPIATYVVRVK
ncbi:hypothetical protein SAMN04488009_0925 [Maribacter sedimenticola]|uniref:Transglutaminase-like domain-containing protein n=1 Tax=Maribacter sedimenticola TaxID=228956 RepID=A0ABY1SDQ5_9FLAO|nr:transglutaminase domain-containing protein [Maribacter sedimenticola]SNR29376.1 hypothetical protein SAMN04488009_0925 [Maribacter sedimenticola]